ncbi:pyruvate dehydrogenase (acetyl-transferring) E1 component subunit alpha [Microbulbifer pacificus]|uniref:Pyruvate dehydrogenase E1 component subunit alpha n=1 Tax=Microbulbifer pacificus TaxID=407164 RepID=A0AAU0N021_9GAMM|nr:pyruvate dehydrogenase (acetyl-transferring) E1 component subunit alpha [Microbulbifer pacificus]WOX05608.1 pyruvate dehydrogenase (acetyl-transferring) E1 component subunit alpha [Microbulbifer pacificus]
MNDKPSQISREQGLQWLQDMLRIRRMEEKCAELYGEEKIRGFLHLYIGEEAVAAGVIPELAAEDAVVATYREHGHALVRGISMNAILAEMFGKQEGCSRGRGGSMHLFDAKTHFYGGNAIVSGGLPLAIGLALADKMQNRPGVTACFFGEGAVAEGEFHESLNLAALWQLPVLFVCENNLYAMGTALARSESVTDIHRKAESYGIDSTAVDGMDVMSVNTAARNALEKIRTQQVPVFLEMRTYRFRAHSMFDPELYREKAEVEQWKQLCPIATLSARLKAQQVIEDGDVAALEQATGEEIQAAVAFAEAGQWEPVEDLLKYVYTDSAQNTGQSGST